MKKWPGELLACGHFGDRMAEIRTWATRPLKVVALWIQRDDPEHMALSAPAYETLEEAIEAMGAWLRAEEAPND